MRSRLLVIGLLFAVVLSRVPSAFAEVNWQWMFGTKTYATKAEALQAMWSANWANAVLTQEAGIVSMTSSEVVYKYVAPPTSPNYTAWTYYPNQQESVAYTTEADAVA